MQQAFAETLDMMSAVATTRDTEAAQQAQLTSLREALRLARLRYDNGYSSYLEVLDAERACSRSSRRYPAPVWPDCQPLPRCIRRWVRRTRFVLIDGGIV